MGLPLSAIRLPRGPLFANEIGVVGTRHRRFLGWDGRYFRSTSRPKTPLKASWRAFFNGAGVRRRKPVSEVVWLGQFHDNNPFSIVPS